MCNTKQNKSPTHCMRLLTFALCTVYPQILAQSENTYGNRSKRIHICNNVDASLYSFIHFSALTILTINFSSVFSELQTDIINTFLKKLSRKRSDRLVIYINWSFWKKKKTSKTSIPFEWIESCIYAVNWKSFTEMLHILITSYVHVNLDSAQLSITFTKRTVVVVVVVVFECIVIVYIHMLVFRCFYTPFL